MNFIIYKFISYTALSLLFILLVNDNPAFSKISYQSFYRDGPSTMQILTGGNKQSWKLEAIQLNNQWVNINSCRQDDLMIFSNDNSYIYEPGYQYCDQNNKPQKGKWELLNNDKEFILEGEELKIGEIIDLNEYRLILRFFDPEKNQHYVEKWVPVIVNKNKEKEQDGIDMYE